MVKSNRNLTIYVRINVVITLLMTIPCIVLLGYYYLHTLSERDQAVQTSVDAQSLASLQQTNLQVMNAQLQTRFNQIFASLSGKLTDPSLSNAGGLVNADIAAREIDFTQSLATYQKNYDLYTSDNMNEIRSILLNDDPQIGPSIINDQQQALNAVATPITGLWPRYKALKKQEYALLDNLDPTIGGNPRTLPANELNTQYQEAYNVLWRANFQFTDLKNTWQRVVDNTVAIGKTVTSLGPSRTTPTLVAIIFTCTILLIFALVWGFISFRTKRSFSLYSEEMNSGNTPIPPSGSIPPVPQLP